MKHHILIYLLLILIVLSYVKGQNDIYNVLIKCKEEGLKIYNFRNEITAINFARQKPHEYCWYANRWMPEDFQEWTYNPKEDDGLILRIEFSLENNYVSVIKGELK